MNANERPLAVTVAAIIGFILSALGLLGAIATPFYGGETTEVVVGASGGAIAVIFSALISAAGLAAFYGYWQMQKWGVYLYAATTVVSLVVAFSAGAFGFLVLLVPAVFLGIGFAYINQMS